MTEAPANPVDASTVILVRHGVPLGSPWQCFMVRRHVRSEFAPAVYVFPGGKVDAGDRDLRLWQLIPPHVSESAPEGDDGVTWLALRIAAIRELFEEAGVLLASRKDGGLIQFDQGDGRFEAYRGQMQAGNLSMIELAERERLAYSVDRLHQFSHWVTPESLPRRYDTRFFIAYVPEHQDPLHDAVETTDSVWISPKEALAKYRDGTFPLVFATEKQLERMAEFASIEGMIAATSASDLEPIMPKIVEREGQTIFLLPGDEGY